MNTSYVCVEKNHDRYDDKEYIKVDKNKKRSC